MDKYFRLSSSRYMIRYTAEFKNKVCKEYIDSKESKSYLQCKYGIKGHDRLLNWLKNYPYLEQEYIPHSMKKHISSEDRSKSELEKRIKELEKQLEWSQLKEEAYLKMIEIAEQEFKISIRKK